MNKRMGGMNMIKEWKEILDYFENNHTFSPEWLINTKVSLQDKIFVVDLLNNYINLIIDEDDTELNFDYLGFETYKRLLIMGAYLGISPIVANDCVEIYSKIETLGFFEEFLSVVSGKDYLDFNTLINFYINVPDTLGYCQIAKIIKHLQETNNIDTMKTNIEKFIEDNKTSIEAINDIIGFNNPTSI